MAGMKVVVPPATRGGYIDVADLKKKADEHADDLAALMVTYPSTHGVFEERSARSARSSTSMAARSTWTART